MIYHKYKKYEWSLWIAVGSKGISHITETWQTKNEGLSERLINEGLSEGLINEELCAVEVISMFQSAHFIRKTRLNTTRPDK